MKALGCKAKNFTCLRCRCQSLTGIGGRSYAAGPNICLRLRRLLTVTNPVCSSPSSRRTPGSVFCTAKAFFVYPLQADAIVIASNIYLVTIGEWEARILFLLFAAPPLVFISAVGYCLVAQRPEPRFNGLTNPAF